MKKSQPLFLSVIVPAYRQEKTIRRDLRRLDQTLQQTPYKYEIICVVDGQVDKTYQRARQLANRRIRVYGYPTNHGKGYAVRYGMARSRGDIIAFIDAGMDIDPNGIIMAIAHMEWYQADIIVGSKRHPVSQVEYPFLRRLYSRGYQLLVHLLFGLNLRDTQTGLKIFRRPVLAKVLPRLLVKKFAFDIELLAVARYLGYQRIYEAPVRIDPRNFRFTSTIRWKTVWEMLIDTLAVFYRLRLRRYYADNNRRRWRYDPELNFRINIG